MVKIICPFCGSDDVFDNGYSDTELHLFCKDYGHQFKISLNKKYWKRDD